MRKLIAIVILVAPLLMLARTAGAQEASDEKKKAKTYFKEGVGFYKDGKYAQALDKFKKTYETWPHWRFHLNIGLCYKELSMFMEAKQELSKFVQKGSEHSDEGESGYFQSKKALVEAALQELDSIIAVLAVQVMPEGASIKMDGKMVGTSPMMEPLDVNPGPHVLEVVADGFHSYREEFFVTEGQEKRFEISLEPKPVKLPEPEPEKPEEPEGKTRHKASPVFWVMGSLTLALAVGAAATGALTIMADQDIKSIDSDARKAVAGEITWSQSDWDDYYSDRQDIADRGKLMGPITTGLMIGAGVALVGTIVTAIVLHPFAPKAESQDAPEDAGPEPVEDAPVALTFAPVPLPQGGGMLVLGGLF